MAIRERKGRAKPWQCYWNNPFTGKRESANFETRLEAEKHDSLVKHRLKFERESFRPVEETATKDITLEQAFLMYLREKQFNKKCLLWQMDAMRLPLGMFGAAPLARITSADLEAVKAEYGKRDLKPATIHNRLGVLRTLFRWCVGRDLCELPKFPKLPAPEYERFIPPSPDELAAIMEAAAPHIRRVIILGAQFGCRVGPCELFKLTWDDADLTQGILRVRAAKKNPNAPWREIPIRASLLPVLAQWALDDKAAGMKHIIHFRGQPVKSIKRAWASALRRAGISRRIRPYDLRHAFATELIAAGADIGTVARLMGHSDASMILQHYQYVMDAQKRAAIEKLPDFGYVPRPCVQIKRD